MDDPEENKKKFVTVYFHELSTLKENPGPGDGYGTALISKVPGTPSVDSCDVPDYLCLSVTSILFFFPLGLMAFRNSLRVRYALQDQETGPAMLYSSLALQLALGAFVAWGFLAVFVSVTVLLVIYN